MNRSQLQELDSFFSGLSSLHYKQGELIIRAGELPGGINFIKKGYVRLYTASSTGQELTLMIFQPGDPFPITWAFNKIPNDYYYEAMTSVELQRGSFEDFTEFYESNPFILSNLVSKLLARNRGLLKRMEYLIFGNAANKVASIILICVERFGHINGNKATLALPLTHKNIACLVGVTRETVSVELKKMERKGLISYEKRHIVVKDLAELKKESLIL